MFRIQISLVIFWLLAACWLQAYCLLVACSQLACCSLAARLLVSCCLFSDKPCAKCDTCLWKLDSWTISKFIVSWPKNDISFKVIFPFPYSLNSSKIFFPLKGLRLCYFFSLVHWHWIFVVLKHQIFYVWRCFVLHN